MPYSRTHSRQNRKRRARKLFYVNVGLIAAILVAGALLVYRWTSDGGPAGDGAAVPGAPSPTAMASQPSSPSASSGDDEPLPDGGDTAAGQDGAEPAPADAAAPADGAAPDELAGETSIDLAFVGDILPAARVGDLIDKNGVDYPFLGSAASLKAADITAGNLETPITTRGTPAEDKQYVFKGKPEYLAGLKNAGIDVLSLANNHTLDQSWEGLSDTMDALDDADLQHMGSGIDEKEAFTPVVVASHGIRVAYIGVTNVVPTGDWKASANHPGVAETYNTTRAVQAIKDAKQIADLVVVMVHWGIERSERPIPAQTNVGYTFIDAGADLVIGSHPHVLQGFESYKGKWIAFSLGNFVFTTAGNTLTQNTGILHAKCAKDGRCELAFEPMFSNQSQPAPMEPADAALLLAHLSELSYSAKVDAQGRVRAAASVPSSLAAQAQAKAQPQPQDRAAPQARAAADSGGGEDRGEGASPGETKGEQAE